MLGRQSQPSGQLYLSDMLPDVQAQSESGAVGRRQVLLLQGLLPAKHTGVALAVALLSNNL